MLKHIKQNYKLYIYALLLFILLFLPYIILNHGIILQPGDPFELNYKLWLGGYNQFHLGTLGNFNWSLGFGANNFSYVFYFLSSPFFWLSLLLPKEFIPYSFLVFGIIQLWLGFVFAHCWLSKVVNNKYAAIIGAFVIGFSAYGIFYLQAEQFIKCLALYSLTLYFTECFLQDKKFNGLVLTIGIIGITQFYLLYQFIPFACLYALIRYLILNQHLLKLKNILLCAAKYVGWLLLGVSVSAVILIPCAYLILSMPRFTTSSIGLLDHLDRYQLYEVITSLFTPLFQKLDSNAFIAASNHKFFGWSGITPLFSLIITPCLLPLVLFMKDKFQRNVYLILYGTLGLFTFFKIFSTLFQASIDTRWYYMFIFSNALIVATLCEQIFNNKFSKKQLLVSFSVPVILIPCFLVISYCLQLNTKEMLNMLTLSSSVIILFILTYGFVIIRNIDKKLLIGLLSLEVLYCGSLFYNFNKPIDYKYFNSNEIDNTIGTYFNQLDDGFYRVMYDSNTVIDQNEDGVHTFSLTTANEPMANAYPGFAFYESLYNANQEEYMSRFKTVNNMKQQAGRTKIYNLLSAKYWYTFNYETEVPFGYKKIFTSSEGFHVYENENYVELGFAYNKTINAHFLLTLPFLEQDRIMQEYLATESSTNKTYALSDRIELLTTLPNSTIRVYEFPVPIVNKNIYLEVFGIPNTKITTYFENQVINSYDLWQFNYIDFPVYEKIDRIVIEANDLYGYGAELPLYIEDLNNSYATQFKELTKEKFENVIFKNDYIRGDITINDKQKYIFTSVPYDEGWNVYVNNEQIEYQKVQLGFIGFELESGTYTVEFKYKIPMLNIGVIVSILSLILLLLCNVKRKK